MLRKIFMFSILCSILMVSASTEKDTRTCIHTSKNNDKLIADQRYEKPKQRFICTAYDLSIESCGKAPDHPAYGLTASGVSLKNKTWDEARAIAVDPRLIKMGSKVLIVFRDKRCQQYNGVYTAVDTGGDIVNKRIDVFIPIRKKALEFGRAEADVYVL